jgi:hypothetical protein
MQNFSSLVYTQTETNFYHLFQKILELFRKFLSEFIKIKI